MATPQVALGEIDAQFGMHAMDRSRGRYDEHPLLRDVGRVKAIQGSRGLLRLQQIRVHDVLLLVIERSAGRSPPSCQRIAIWLHHEEYSPKTMRTATQGFTKKNNISFAFRGATDIRASLRAAPRPPQLKQKGPNP
jgi:hypothetical protein